MRSSAAAPGTVGVVVISHNYGRFLKECLDSVLNQTRPADEVLVIDDSSEDQTSAVALAREVEGVRLLRVEHSSPFLSRRAALHHTTAEILCLLDADDRLPDNYLEEGLRCFSAAETGVVYSDLQLFGTRSGRMQMPALVNQCSLERENHVHAASLVRREALVLSGALQTVPPPDCAQEDWFMWRAVAAQGWAFRRQSAALHYRRHAASRSRKQSAGSRNYWDRAAMSEQQVAMLVVLRGRPDEWSQLEKFLDRQLWPHRNCELVLADVSFGSCQAEAARRWMVHCNYGNMRWTAPAAPGEPTAMTAAEEHSDQSVAAWIWRLMHECRSSWIWLIDGIAALPVETCERLLRHANEQTDGVIAGHEFPGQDCGRLSDCPDKHGGTQQPESGIRLLDCDALMLRRDAICRIPSIPVEPAGTLSASSLQGCGMRLCIAD